MATLATPSSRFSLRALLMGRCPRCRKGAIFPPMCSPRLLFMNQACDSCGLRFEREAGYFLGAMYVSYTLATIFLGLVTLVGPSRIQQGHHWFTDVTASYLLGTSYVVGLAALYRRVKAHRAEVRA